MTGSPFGKMFAPDANTGPRPKAGQSRNNPFERVATANGAGDPHKASMGMGGAWNYGKDWSQASAKPVSQAGKEATGAAGAAPMPASASITNPDLGLDGAPAQGTESGPGILESWFNQRAAGSDPGYEYATSRGMKDLNNAYAARGMFNSGAAMQGTSDYLANSGAQRMAQLDSLAGGASGEHQGRLNSMFGQGQALAGGQSGLAGQYDLGAANAMSTADQAQLMMALQKAGVDQKAAQGFINNLLGVGAIAAAA